MFYLGVPLAAAHTPLLLGSGHSLQQPAHIPFRFPLLPLTQKRFAASLIAINRVGNTETFYNPFRVERRTVIAVLAD
jgi:hypothetical protein